jgi:hypothetical protein
VAEACIRVVRTVVAASQWIMRPPAAEGMVRLACQKPASPQAGTEPIRVSRQNTAYWINGYISAPVIVDMYV